MTTLYVSRARWFIIVGGLGSVLGSFVPWATVSAGSQLRSLLHVSFSASISAIDLDGRYGWAIVLGGAVAFTLALRLAIGHGHSPQAALLATGGAAVAVVAALLVASQAQQAGTSINWIGSLIDTSSLLSVSPGFGFWIVVCSGMLGIAGGLMAYSGR